MDRPFVFLEDSVTWPHFDATGALNMVGPDVAATETGFTHRHAQTLPPTRGGDGHVLERDKKCQSQRPLPPAP